MATVVRQGGHDVCTRGGEGEALSSVASGSVHVGAFGEGGRGWAGAAGRRGGRGRLRESRGVLHVRRLPVRNSPPVNRLLFPAITYLFLIQVSDGDQTEARLRDR